MSTDIDDSETPEADPMEANPAVQVLRMYLHEELFNPAMLKQLIDEDPEAEDVQTLKAQLEEIVATRPFTEEQATLMLNMPFESERAFYDLVAAAVDYWFGDGPEPEAP